MRQIKAKRSSMKRAENASNTPPITDTALLGGMMSYRNLDSSTSKEVMDLQQQLIATTKEYRMVKASIMKAQNGKRSNELTKGELEKLPQGSDSKMYRSVGKMFILASRGEIINHLDENIEREGKEEKDLSCKLEYLERRIKSQQQNIQELTKSATSE